MTSPSNEPEHARFSFDIELRQLERLNELVAAAGVSADAIIDAALSEWMPKMQRAIDNWNAEHPLVEV